MDPKQKNILFWLGSAVLVALTLFLLVSTNQAANTAATTNTISFSGQGKVVAKPDIALLDLSILTEAETSKAAQNENSNRSKRLVEFLKKEGIEDKDIKTTGYNIYPQYTYPQYEKARITGYQVNQMIQVRVRNLDAVDTILDGVVSAGANQINNFQLTVDDSEELLADARDEAIADAKEKARALERQLGVKLGRIVNFSESGAGMPVPMYKDAMSERAYGMGGGGPAIPGGENEISVNVQITYQIK
ncbi:MAG: SIMPL domain-containing protein [Candidatus Paceibacterota bacterium]|nr:MAG: SIMPL domain-containing protein [Candidatus Paceibacterota bacterium]